MWREAKDENDLRWAVTAAFYASVHCIDAHLAGHGVRPSSHRSRERNMVNPSLGVPPKVFAAHRFLQQESEAARYLMQRFHRSEVRSLLDGHLARVMGFVGLRSPDR